MGCLCSVLTLCKHQTVLTLFMLCDAGVAVTAEKGWMFLFTALVGCDDA